MLTCENPSCQIWQIGKDFSNGHLVLFPVGVAKFSCHVISLRLTGSLTAELMVQKAKKIAILKDPGGNTLCGIKISV